MKEITNRSGRPSPEFIENVTVSVLETAKQISVGGTLWKIDFHSGLQKYISAFAGKFGLCGAMEYPIRAFRPDGKTGKIDVAWFEGPGPEPGFRPEQPPVAVFEIDSGLRKKSIGKLLAVDAPFRFWVHYGKKEAYSLLEKNDPEGLIRLIRVERPEFKKLI
ncbi:MAG: hypothetical protein PHV51_07950 [Methanosarcinaceae archaeon]|nr:hypothetical protein [Methanosarcinaceae archaeon]MDD4498062.1 hypothetical protein [Methanosarcinaceae archaeon]